MTVLAVLSQGWKLTFSAFWRFLSRNSFTLWPFSKSSLAATPSRGFPSSPVRSMSLISPKGDTEPGNSPRQRSILSCEANESLPCLRLFSSVWIDSSL